jgi:hypothetical protein
MLFQSVKSILVIILLMSACAWTASAQCATAYSNTASDGAGNVHAWTVLTDNYTNLGSGCAPPLWVTYGFRHTYSTSVTITSPSHRTTTATGSGSQLGGSGVGTVRTDAFLAVGGEVGTFTESGYDSIICSVAGAFFSAPWSSSWTPPPPLVSGVGDNATGSNTIYVDTSGYLAIYGSVLTAWGETPIPTVHSDDNAIPLSLSWASDNQLNVSYTVGTSARTGQHYLTVTTEAGTSNTGSYMVYDPSPVIISNSDWQAGTTTTITISGSGFGTVSPTVTISDGLATFTQISASDTVILGTVTIPAADPGGAYNLTVTSNGYGNGFQGALGQTRVSPSKPVSVWKVCMALSKVGATVISTDGNYSEDTTVQVKAVRCDNGALVSTFTGAVNLAEDGTTIYSQNGGVLPSSVNITSGGIATVVVRSLAGPRSEGPTGLKPLDAQIKTTNFPLRNGQTLSIPQWIISGVAIDSHATGSVFDWVQAKTRDIFQAAGSQGDLYTVLSKVDSYSIQIGNFHGQTTLTRALKTPIALNPYYNPMRIKATDGYSCGFLQINEFRETLLHEARHAYQGARAVDNDVVDRDWLSYPAGVAPAEIALDSATLRKVCDNFGIVPAAQIGFLGPTVFDSYLGNVEWALQMDAETFAQTH